MKGQNKNRILRYSIRKLSIGVVSVVVGAFTILGVSNIYGADFSRGGVVYAAEESKEELEQNDNTQFNKIRENVKEVLKKIVLPRGVEGGYLFKIISAENYEKLQKEVFDLFKYIDNNQDKAKLFIAIVDGKDYLSNFYEKNLETNSDSWSGNFEKFKNSLNILKNKVNINKSINKLLDNLFEKASKFLFERRDEDYGKSSVIKLEESLNKIKKLKTNKEFTKENLEELEKIINPLLNRMEEERELKNKLRETVKSLKDKKDIDRLNIRVNRAKDLSELKKYEAEIDVIKELEKLEYLSPEGISFYRDILRQETIEKNQEKAIKGMKLVLDLAKERNEEKKKIAEKVNGLPYLSIKDKAVYIHAIKTANGVDSANVALELANEKNTAAKSVKDYAQRPTQKNFEKASDLTKEKYTDLYEKLIEVASNIELGTNNFSEAWNKKDGAERTRQLEIIESKEKAKKEIDGLKTITEHSKNLAKKLIDEASNKEDVDKIVAEAKILENRKMKEKAKKEIDGLKTITEHSKNLAKKLIDEATNKEDVDKIVAEAKRLEDRKLKERERLLKEAKEKEKRAKINKDLEGLSDAWKKEDLKGRKSQLDRIKPVQPEKPSVPWTPLTPATPIKPITKIKPHLLTEESVKYVKGSMKDVVIKTDAEISSFVEVRVGGKVLDPSNYEVKDGSTMVTLKNSYLETLPLGKYVIEVVSKETDKYYSSILKTTLTVVENKDSNNKPEEKPQPQQKTQPQQKPSENNQNPETGDLGVVTSVVTALAAGAALVATRKKDE
ncbi:YSIRK-type signal peptide-containing protein [Helcococcus ovis]|nr:YSIRK-type signal peptide-containing protein [Helcococcus ovis]TFF64318.1 YSIRK-type signal peptide-containing protein [Helcococcus ovis]